MDNTIRTTSKIALKLSCLNVCNGDIEKADAMYKYFVSDITLPETDPLPPSTLQQVTQTAGGIFNWVKDNKAEIAEALGILQSFRAGQITTEASAIAPVITDIPPLPTEL